MFRPPSRWSPLQVGVLVLVAMYLVSAVAVAQAYRTREADGDARVMQADAALLRHCAQDSQRRCQANDPWQTAYRLERSGDDWVVISAGPDRRFGSADDVRVER